MFELCIKMLISILCNNKNRWKVTGKGQHWLELSVRHCEFSWRIKTFPHCQSQGCVCLLLYPENLDEGNNWLPYHSLSWLDWAWKSSCHNPLLAQSIFKHHKCGVLGPRQRCLAVPEKFPPPSSELDSWHGALSSRSCFMWWFCS